MMNFLRKYQYHIFLFTMVVFLSGTFIGFGGYFFTSKGEGDAIAEVNGEKIPLRLFYSHYRQALDQIKPDTPLDDAGRQQKRDEALRDLIQSLVFANEAKRYGIDVPDQQVAISLTQVPGFQEKGVFNPRLYVQALQSQIHLSPTEFEEEQRRNVAFFKLRWLIQSCIKIPDSELEALYAFRHGGQMKDFEKEKEHFREELWKEKVLWSFNQWFNQMAQHVHVKTHLELLEGMK